MAESAEPASEAVEIKESGEQVQVAEDQQQQQQELAAVVSDVQGDEAETKGEAADMKGEEVAQEVGQQEHVRVQQEEPTEEQTLEREEKQGKEEEGEQDNEEKQEKPLEDLQDTMQLPVIDTSQGAIEDEEMPSMVTLSSTSRIDESETNMKQEVERSLVEEESISQPNPGKENDDSDDSVCVIDDDEDDDDDNDDDDDDDDEDEDDNEREEIAFDEDEDGSSYSDDEGSEESNQRCSDNYGKRVIDVQRVEVEEEDDEEDDEPEDGEDMEDQYDPDGFDGGSDNFELRHSNGLTRDSKERSASLQDINLIKPKKVNVNPFSQKARMERNQTNMDRRVAGKQYAHIESKVKKYIMDLSEQRRLSTERRKRDQDEARYRIKNINEIQLHRNEEIVMTCKTIKDYTEKGLQEVAECEEESEEVYQLPQCLENGEISIFPRRSIGNGEKLTRPDDDGMDVDPIDVETIRHDEKVDRINGATITERKGLHRREENSKPVMNGENPSSTVCDLRTLTYEEYMKGSIGKGVTEEIIDEDEDIQEALTPPPYNDKGTNMLRIDNVTSIYHSEQQVDSSFHDRKTPTLKVNQVTETLKHEDPEVSALKMQLQNRNTQFESLRDAYQKTVSENMAMKVELENLRKMVSYLQEQHKPVPETTTTAIQTEEPVPRSMPNIEIDSEVPADPRLATTSMISAMSSQWTDSIGSALISMEPPPNVTNALNSDESSSQAGKTPLKQKNAFSRAFMTSSKILQTLSNITHGRLKQSRQSKERARKLSASEKEPAVEVGVSNPRKRKASDTMEISSSAQPYKIPHKEPSTHPANAQESETAELADEDAQSSAAENDNRSEIDLQQMVINNDDVKVFVYPEDEIGQEHSFLIQAREISSNAKPGVRECGPYLLGNVEVYMTEMNGTINIWGKEVNESSATSQNADEMETSTRSKDLKSGLRWQSTPRIFNEGSASTSKKSRVVPRFTQQQKQHLREVNNTVVECDSCQSHGQRLSWPTCSHESQRACCPAVRADEMLCGYANQRNTTGSCCQLNRFVDARRFSMNDVHQTHSSCCCHGGHQLRSRSPAQPEPYTNHQPFVRRHSFEPTDDEENAEESADEENDQYTSKGSHMNEDNSAHSYSNSKLAPPSSNSRRGSDNSDGSIFINDSAPLLGQKQPPDAESNKRRPRGKKVRGLLMDLLKGCGDCRTSNPMNKTNLQPNASIYAPSTSTLRKIACSPNQPACSLRSNEKCSACRTGTDKTAEFEAQLEYFRSQMDKLRSHSDNLREMLDTLRKDNPN